MHNYGIVNTGDHATFEQVAVGAGAQITVGHPQPAPRADDLSPAAPPRRSPGTCHLAVITVLAAEAHAVRNLLRTGSDQRAEVQHDRRFHTATLRVEGAPYPVVHTRTLEPGQRSIGAAFADLHQYYRPQVVVLLGIGGGIHPDLTIGDVVLGTEVVHYDARREDDDQVRRRPQMLKVPAGMQAAVNAFFDDHHEPAHLVRRDAGETVGFRVRSGIVGSGETVVRSATGDTRTYLSQLHDKTLAVETEAAGLAQAFHENRGKPGAPSGWLTVRGISDLANADKDDGYHRTASANAAAALQALLPYLR